MFKTFSIYILLFFALYIFLIEPNLILVKKINVESDKIKNVRVVFLSDFHFSKFAFLRIKRIINKVNNQNPDIVLLGGDYAVLHNIKVSMDMNKIADNFSLIKSKYGVYSVLGNHDYNRESDFIKNKLKEKGIKILENSSYDLDIAGQKISIAGVSDMQYLVHFHLMNHLMIQNLLVLKIKLNLYSPATPTAGNSEFLFSERLLFLPNTVKNMNRV